MNLTQTVDEFVLDETQSLNERFIHEAIKEWDKGETDGVSFAFWVKVYVATRWHDMVELN